MELVTSRRDAPAVGRDVLAGLAASLLAIAYCLSFSALLFQGALQSGLPVGLWALLIGSAISGLYVAYTTTIAPVAAGPNNPAVAVLSVLATTVSGLVLANGGSPEEAVSHVLIAFVLASFLTGLALYFLGALRLGEYVRFVPYPVIGGFLAASGWLLVAGGVKVVTGRNFDLLNLAGAVPPETWAGLFVAVLFAASVYALKWATGSMSSLPIAFILSAALLYLVLWLLNLNSPDSGWFLAGTSAPAAWSPVRVSGAESIDWGILLRAWAEIVSAAGVTVVALLLDVSGLEVTRMKTANLDSEFRSNGAANILAAPLGGVMGKVSVNGSRLIDETGGTTRLSGLVAAALVALVAVVGLDLARLVPAAILGGVLVYVGSAVLAETLLRSPAHRSWSEFGLALAIMLAIVKFGYLAGVISGFIGACLMFAFNYSRIAIIRRHLTREVYASNVDRSTAAMALLQESGDRIHIFWLSGYIFFGSSHRLYEAIRTTIEAHPSGERRYAVLDFANVAGLDTSALLSLLKLRNFAEQSNLTLAFAGLDDRMQMMFEGAGLFGVGRPHVSMLSRNQALEWCEERILEEERESGGPDVAADLAAWLATEVGDIDWARRLVTYFEPRTLGQDEVLYKQGDPPDGIDLIVDGTVAVRVRSEPGLAVLVRRMSKRTVLGEMGFFRNLPRAATVTAEPRAVVYRLSRQSYERLLVEEPEAGRAFLLFIIRALSDRLDFANSGIAALS